ncbi:MAG: hypothetical protein J6P40_07825, partial [Oscillospiraceae bacterium]|nr:hypothetical protein [Oscillospiraceae bacterium]
MYFRSFSVMSAWKAPIRNGRLLIGVCISGENPFPREARPLRAGVSSAGKPDNDVAERGAAAVGKDAEMSAVNGRTDAGTQR